MQDDRLLFLDKFKEEDQHVDIRDLGNGEFHIEQKQPEFAERHTFFEEIDFDNLVFANKPDDANLQVSSAEKSQKTQPSKKSREHYFDCSDKENVHSNLDVSQEL